MNKPVRTTTPNGEQVVMLPAAEYDRLLIALEDARDAAVADDALATSGGGEGEILQEADMIALLDAPSPLAFWRKRRSLTQAELAKKVDVSQAYLAQIEGGKRTGDVALYRKLARALGVGIEDLMPGHGMFEEVAVPQTQKSKNRRWYRVRPANLPGISSDGHGGFQIDVSCPETAGRWAVFSISMNRAQAEHVQSALLSSLKRHRKK